MAITNVVLNSISNVSNSVSNRVAGAIPEMTVKSERANKAISWIGEKISSPENRLILGVTALMSQPFIDLSNKKVDEETRQVSAARTVAKIIAGTLTGVIVRAGCIKAIDAFTKLPREMRPDMKFKKMRAFFTPSPGILKDLGQYKNSLGTIVSLFVMLFTNFLFDAPLTKFLTNKFVNKIHEDKKKATESNELAVKSQPGVDEFKKVKEASNE